VDTTTAISIFSALLALASAVFAASSAKSARRSADLAEREQAERTKSLQAYLVDTAGYKGPDHEEVVAMCGTIANLASQANTVLRTQLVVHEYATSGEPSRLVLSPVEDIDPPGATLKRLAVPLNLQARSTATGWLTFVIPENFVSSKTLDKYELIFTDSLGGRTTLECYVVNRIVYAPDQS
jgi:hypothetical protein